MDHIHKYKTNLYTKFVKVTKIYAPSCNILNIEKYFYKARPVRNHNIYKRRILRIPPHRYNDKGRRFKPYF